MNRPKRFAACMIAAATVAIAGCEQESDEARWARRAREAWEGPCHDSASLLATTAGLPDSLTCPNRLHRMQVQVATHPSNEEAAALVFCKCEQPEGGAQ